MARRTHLPTPHADEIRALLQKAGITAYKVAPLIGVSEQALLQAMAGQTTMRGTAWKLLRVTLSRSARAELQEPLTD